MLRASKEVENPLLFAYTSHIDLDDAPIAQLAVERADVVLVENCGGSEESRDQWHTMYDTITKIPDRKWSEPTKQWYAGVQERDKLGLYLEIAVALKGTGKTICEIDRFDSPETQQEQEAFQDSMGKLVTGLMGDRPVSKLLGIINDQVETSGNRNRQRDDLIWLQINQYYKPTTRGRRAKPTKFMVVQGAAHAPSYHAAKRAGYLAERVFIMNGAIVPSSAIVFNARSAATRYKSLHPDKPVPTSLLKEELVANYIVRATNQENNTELQLSEKDQLCRRKVLMLSPSQIDHILSTIDHAKATEPTRQDRISKILTLMDEYDLLIEDDPNYAVL